MTIRIFQSLPMQSGLIIEPDSQAKHHLLNVLRLKTGHEVMVFNGEGGEYSGQLLISGKRVNIEILKYHDVSRESSLNIHLVQSISRGDRMDFSIQKAVELGVRSIRPLFTSRSIGKLDPKRLEKRIKHWQGIIISACEQSGRCLIPELKEPINLPLWLTHLPPEGLKLILDPNAPQGFCREVLNSTEIHLLIGPEGGFSEQEIMLANTHNCQSIRLGPRVLRTETATISALTLVQGLAGDLCKNAIKE